MPFDVTIRRGDDQPMGATVDDPGLVAPLNEPGAVVWFLVKRRKSDPDSAALIRKKTGEGITHDTGTDASWIISGDETEANWRESDLGARMVWDVQYKSGRTGQVKTIDEGGLRVVGDVTRERV